MFVKNVVFFFMIVSVFFINGKESIKFTQYIKVLEEKLPAIQKNKLDVIADEIALNKSYSAYDVALSLSGYGSGSQSYSNSSNSKNYYSPGAGGDLTVKSVLPSGTEISAGGSVNYKFTSGETTSTTSTGAENKTEWSTHSLEPVISIGLSQPILKNWLGLADRYAINTAKKDLAISKINYEINKKTILTGYSKRYFEWLGLHVKLEHVGKTIKNSELYLSRILQKNKMGLVDIDSVEAARYSLYQNEKKRLTILKTIADLENSLSDFIDMSQFTPATEEIDDYYKEALGSELNVVPFDDTDNAKIIGISKSKIEDSLIVNKNKLLPDLNLFANVNIPFNYTSKKTGDETEYYYFYDNDAVNVNFKAGLTLTYPLGNLSARNTVKETENLLQKIRIEYQDTLSSYNSDLKLIIHFKDYVLRNMDIGIKSLESLTARYDYLFEQFKKGRADSKDITDAENSILSEKMSVVDYKINLISNMFDYFNIVR